MKQGNDCILSLFFFSTEAHVPALCLTLLPVICHVAFVSPSFSQPLFPYYCLLFSLSSSVKTFVWSMGNSSSEKKEDPTAIWGAGHESIGGPQ